MDEYPDREMTIVNKDFLSIDRLSYIDTIDNGNRVQELLDGIKSKDYEDEPVGRVFASTMNPRFLKSLIHSTIIHPHITSLGRFEYYMCLKPYHFIVSLRFFHNLRFHLMSKFISVTHMFR